MILPSVGLSPKRHLPTLYIGRRVVLSHEYMRIAWQMRDWKLKRTMANSYIVGHEKDSLLLTETQTANIICEWKNWQKYYLPGFSLEGKTVLDIGAGCGETAYFYFLHGVKQVIAVEMDPVQVALLKENSSLNRWNVSGERLRIIPRAFELEDINRETFDFVKMDIEAGEVFLLSLDKIDFPIVLEAHGEELMNRLLEKFKLHIVSKSKFPLQEAWIVRNY